MPNTSMQKIDSILTAIEKLNKRLAKIDNRMERIKERVTKTENGFKEIKLLPAQVKDKTPKSEIAEINERIPTFKNSQRDAETNRIMAESYNKTFNLLIHGLDEIPNNVWEHKRQTRPEFERYSLKLDQRIILKLYF